MTDALDQIPLTAIKGRPASLEDWDGQVLLIVNTASACGLTPQYEGLEALYAKYKEHGFVVLGFPSNDFAGQEPGSEDEIAEFCRSTYGIEFPMFEKAKVTGPDKHPLFAALTEAVPEATGNGSAFRERLARFGPTAPPEILWNFEKFIVGRDRQVTARFAPDVLPSDERLVLAVERELFASE
jgi:glutathione peroxidase